MKTKQIKSASMTDDSRAKDVVAARTNPAYAAQLKLWAKGLGAHPGTNYSMTEAKDFSGAVHG